jgi:hypothetical protein
MALLIDLNKLKNDASLRARFDSAIDKSASDVLVESVETTNHAVRIKWAKDALYNKDIDMVNRMIGLFMQNATLQISGLAVSDNDILFIVASYIDIFAVGFYS